MSLTLIFKGHHIDSEISTNENMRKLGIKCAVQETREQMTGLEDCASEPGCSGNCAACTPEAAAAVHGSAKKIIGDKFSANRKHGQSEFRLPVFLFSRFQPHDAERRSVRRRTLPDHHLRLRPATRHFTGATEKPRINQIRLVVTQRTIIRQRKRFAPLLRRESTPPAAVSHSYVEVVRK